MSKDKISKRTVDALPAPARGEVRLWDEKLAGFCVRSYAPTKQSPAGRKVYAVKYRVDGRQRWFTIGEHGQPWTDDAGVTGDLTAERARDQAERVLGDAKRGSDPQAQKRERRKSLTVGELIDLYLADGPATRPAKRATSWATDKTNLDRHVRPSLGARAAREIDKGDIARLIKDITNGATAADIKTKKRGRSIVKGGPAAAARALATVRAMFSWAMEHDHLIGPNPAVGLKLAAGGSSERYLTDEEAAALFNALDQLEADLEITAAQAAIFRLLLLTGARRNEIAGLKWSEVDFARKRLVLPPNRTKAGATAGERRIQLNSAAVSILEPLPRPKGAVWLFPAARGAKGHTTTASKVWSKVVVPKAKLSGVRVHDLRHSFASFALADGVSLAMIGKALGHANSRSTERYAHLSDDPLRALSEGVAARMGKKKP